MNIRLTINKTTLDVTCDDSSVLINEVYENDGEIVVEVVKPEYSMPNVYEQLITDRSVV
jgi:hypothetical protein